MKLLTDDQLEMAAAGALKAAAGLPGLGPLIDGLPQEWLREMRGRVGMLMRLAVAGDETDAFAALGALARNLAGAGLEVGVIHQLGRALEDELSPMLIASSAGSAQALAESLRALHSLVSRAVEAAAREFVQSTLEARATVEDGTIQAFRTSAQRFARLNASGVIGTVWGRMGSRVIDVNEAFAAMLGYTREELIALGDLTRMALPEWSGADQVATRQLRTTGVARPYEKEYLRKDGTRVPVLVGAAMLDEPGARAGSENDEFIGFILDISARRRLELVQREAQTLEADKVRLQETNRSKHEFIAGLSHDLRAPLNAIIGFGQLLQDGEAGELQPQQKDFVGTIVASGKALLALINDVIDLVRAEADRLQLRLEPVDLQAVFNDVSAVVQHSMAAKRLRLESVVDASVREGIVLDPARVKQILYNCLSQGIKLAPEESVLYLRALPEGADKVRLEVEHEGMAVAEQLDAMFSDLRRAAQQPLHGGGGLLPVLTRRLVEAQGGRVEMRTVTGGSGTFAAVLPRKPATQPPPLAPPAVRPDVAGSSILVVEDDGEDQMTLVEALEAAGYAVQVAGRGKQAIDLCLERRFDAITLDLILPDMSGTEVLERIRAEGRNRETPVLVVSIAADSAVGFAVNGVLPKPAPSQSLLRALRAAGVSPGESGDVMVVDDDPAALRLMSAALKQVGFRASCFDDAEMGLRAAEKVAPKAIVLDLLMPGVDGFQFLERLRRQPSTRDTPVLVWTTKDLTDADLLKLKRAAQDVVPKGHEGVQTLLDSLRQLTGGVQRQN